jgi:hypothetical protein
MASNVKLGSHAFGAHVAMSWNGDDFFTKLIIGCSSRGGAEGTCPLLSFAKIFEIDREILEFGKHH